jgi:rsbT co-antagonist protein RsbR
MLVNQQLHGFLCEKNNDFTEQWYNSLDKSKGGVYSTKDPEKVEKLKQQNREFHDHFCTMFSKELDEFTVGLFGWVKKIAKDEDFLATPLTAVLEEFFRIQKQYLTLIDEFAALNPDKVTPGEVGVWKKAVVETLNEIVLEFTIQNTKASEERLALQQQLVMEISTPVIQLTSKVGFLPLVGEISPDRAQMIFEKALAECSRKNIERLFIDLSGVPVIDTMVAQQIFQVISGLKIIGVDTSLSGISPEIAQTAVQLGINFDKINVYNTLSQAIKYTGLQQ